MDESSLIANFKRLRRHVEDTGEWVVAVCPENQTVFSQCRKIMVSSLSAGVEFSGRTARFPNQGLLTLVSHQTKMDSKKPFSVAFIGWGRVGSQKTDLMENWRQQAQSVLTLGGDLQ